MVYSTNTIYLYDIRNSSLPVSEKHLNINFKEMELKNFFRTGCDLFDERIVSLSNSDYFGVDKTGKDNSVLHFTQKEEILKKELFTNFVEFTLINTDCRIHDSLAFSYKDNYYVFTVDDYGGLNYHIYEKNKSNKITHNNENLEMNSHFEEIRGLFEENNVKRLFSGKGEKVNNINVFYENKNESDNDLDNSDVDENIFYDEKEAEDDQLKIGNLKINGNDQKVYEVLCKREILQKISNNNFSKEDYNMNMNNQNLDHFKENFGSSLNDIDKNPFLKYLFDNFNK